MRRKVTQLYHFGVGLVKAVSRVLLLDSGAADMHHMQKLPGLL